MSYFTGDNDEKYSDSDNDSVSSSSDISEKVGDNHELDEEASVGVGNVSDDGLDDGLDDDGLEEDDLEGGGPEDEDEDNDEGDNNDEGEESDIEYMNEENGDGDEGEGEEKKRNTLKKSKKLPSKNVYKKPSDYIDKHDDDEDDDANGEQYLQKFDHSLNENYVLNYHPESILHNYDEISAMSKVVRNSDGIIIDKLHRTIPYLTKYEKARIIGQRAKQINSGAYPLIKVPENVIDGLIIAELELKQKKIPFIIRRPLPNGGSEYWKVKDLEDISF